MKKLLAIIMILLLVVSACACNGNGGSSGEGDTSEKSETSESVNDEDGKNGASGADTDKGNSGAAKADPDKTLVIYFSRVGNTDFSKDVDASSSASIVANNSAPVGNAEQLAIWAADAMGCDKYEITVKDKYPEDYNETIDLAKDEQNKDVRPELAGEIKNFDSYDAFYLIFPNWWGDLPMALYTFFDQYDFSGKTINVAATHGGSRFSGTIATIQELEPKATAVEGIEVYASDVPDAKQDVVNWVNGK